MSLHQQAFEGGGMVPYRHPLQQPLLPYEKRLIQALGCSEEEYRQFAQEVERRVSERPEEYAHIPNVRNDATTVAIVSLVVSVLSSAAAILLAPKPPDFSNRGVRQKKLGGIQGRDIYTPTVGFDAAQDLAEYGQIVPIAFTRKETLPNGSTSGGLLVSPQLVWSRMKSRYSFQIAEMVMIVGQGPMDRPDLAGIFLGNNALDALYEDYFDFFYTNGSGEKSRLKNFHRRYGNFIEPSGDEAFTAPSNGALDGVAFCGAFTPSSQTKFGVYSGIPNGTPYRPDWKIVSIPQGPLKATAERQKKNEQKKYVDQYLMDKHDFGGNAPQDDKEKDKEGSEKAGMPGTGTNYVRRVGVFKHIRAADGHVTEVDHDVRDTSKHGHESWKNVKTEVDCVVGDKIKILIGKGTQAIEPFGPSPGFDPVDLSDIRASIQSECARYDQMFPLGATFMIGRMTFKVTGRTIDGRFDPDVDADDGQTITLECIERWSAKQNRLGIVDKAALTKRSHLPYTKGDDAITEAFYPILRYELGTVRNTRACDVTEIGIKSQVWTKFNGITHFAPLPTPRKVANGNKEDISYTEGKISSYAHRVSFFALDVRPSNYDASINNGRNNGWENMAGGYLFAVVGDAPVDMYNSIQIKHQRRDQYEYRFRPFESSSITKGGKGGGTLPVLSLDQRADLQSYQVTTPHYGTFTITTKGTLIEPNRFYVHKEMVARHDEDSEEPNIVVSYQTPEKDTDNYILTHEHTKALETKANYEIGEEIRFNTFSNIFSILLDSDPYYDNLPVGTKAVKEDFQYSREGNRKVFMRVHLVAVYRDLGLAHGRNKWWELDYYELVRVEGNFKDGETFVKTARNGNDVQFGWTFKLTHPYKLGEAQSETNRLFQRFSGVAEVSHYGDLISRSCDGSPEHEVIYVNESLVEDKAPVYDGCAVAGLKLKSSDNFNQLDQVRLYMDQGLKVERLIDNDTDSQGNPIPAASNLLTDLLWYLVTNKDTGAGELLNSSLVDKAALTTTGRYLRANRLYWDDVIAEPINLRSWLAEQAAGVLCFVGLKNGKLNLEPALPYDSNYEINASEPVPISAMFTGGNIIEDSLEITWLELEERKMFKSAIIYRESQLNEFPEEKTLTAHYSGDQDLPIEQFDAPFITSDEHARKVARYFLALRKYLTHTITFKTLPWGLNLEAGKFIRVATELSPYRPDNNGIVTADGTVVSVSELADGSHDVYFWQRRTGEAQDAVQEGSLQISGGKAQNLFDSVFSVKGGSHADEQIYQIEALDIDQDGIVTIKAGNYAVDSEGRSKIAIDVIDTANAITLVGPTIEN